MIGPGEFSFAVPQGHDLVLESPTAQGASVVARYPDGWRKFAVDSRGKATLIGLVTVEEVRRWAGPRRVHEITH
jgi:hypothetical protein